MGNLKERKIDVMRKILLLFIILGLISLKGQNLKLSGLDEKYANNFSGVYCVISPDINNTTINYGYSGSLYNANDSDVLFVKINGKVEELYNKFYEPNEVYENTLFTIKIVLSKRNQDYKSYEGGASTKGILEIINKKTKAKKIIKIVRYVVD